MAVNNRELFEDAAGYNLNDRFFVESGIDPNGRDWVDRDAAIVAQTALRNVLAFATKMRNVEMDRGYIADVLEGFCASAGVERSVLR